MNRKVDYSEEYRASQAAVRDVLGTVVSERWFQNGCFRTVVSAKVVSAFESWQDSRVRMSLIRQNYFRLCPTQIAK